jgi:hypothetical protein
MVSTLDRRAIALGAIAGFVVAFPGLILGGLTDAVVFVVFVFAGLVAAGFVAGSKRPDAPLSNGIVAALGTYLAAALIAVALLVAKGDTINPAAYVFDAAVAAGLGLFGGYLAERRSV